MNSIFFTNNNSLIFGKEIDKVVYYPFKTYIKVYKNFKLVNCYDELCFKHINQEKKENTIIDTFVCEDIYIYRYVIQVGSVYKSFAKVINKSNSEIKVCYLTSLVLSGIFDNITESKDCLVHYFQSGWCAEGNLQTASLDDLHLPIVNDRDSQTYHDFISETSYTTKTYFPTFYFAKKNEKYCAFVLVEPKGRWQVRLSYNRAEYSDNKTLSIITSTGSNAMCDFYINLKNNEEYETIITVFGLFSDVTECLKNINEYKRSKRKNNELIVFNDYMNCIWAKPTSGNTIPLVDKCAELGVDVYCMDSGWYKEINEVDWFGKMGDWNENDELFIGFNFKGIVDYVNNKGMKFGMWFELEVATTNSQVAKNDETWFIHQNGERVFESGRYFLDVRNPIVREYLVSRVKYFYDMGVKYIKNDYNGTFSGCDSLRGGKILGLEEYAEGVMSLYEEISKACPGIIIENCASGGMRCDENILSRATLTSFSDCENYRKYPAIVKGSLNNVLPEQLGIWASIYPNHIFEKYKSFPSPEVKERLKNGEETIFSLVTSFMGKMYLSGRIDKADRLNLSLIKDAIMLHRSLMNKCDNSYPVVDTTNNNFYVKEGIVVQEINLGEKTLIAVWHLENGESTYVVNGKNVKVVFPVGEDLNREIIQQNSDSQITVKFNKNYQARLFEITNK